jgi:hypothetical protein
MKKAVLSLFYLIASFCLAQPGGQELTCEQKELNEIRFHIFSLLSPDTFDINYGDRAIVATLKDSVIPMGLISAAYFNDSAIIHNPFFQHLWTRFVI